MAYANEAHEKAHEDLGKMLRKIYGEKNVQELDEVTYYMWRGSTVVHFTASTYGKEDKPMVEIWAKVTVDTPFSDGLARFLILENSQLNFGGFRFYPYQNDPQKGNVVFEQRLPWFGITPDLLELMADMVSWTGDEYDDKIVQQFGGKTMEDAVNAKTVTPKDEDWE